MFIYAWTVNVCGVVLESWVGPCGAQVPLCLCVAAASGGGSAIGCLEFAKRDVCGVHF